MNAQEQITPPPQKRQRIEPAKFKRDYVAYMAIAFFFLMIFSEVTLAIGIPLYIKRTNMWAEQVARQELIGYFDYLRSIANKYASNPNPQVKSEVELVTSNLNLLAIYLREHASTLTIEQASELQKDFGGFERILERLNQGKAYGAIIPLKTDKAIRQIATELDEAGKKL